MWVLSMINLPTLVLAFLYAVSWSEGWVVFFFLTNYLLFSCKHKEIFPKGLSGHDMAELCFCSGWWWISRGCLEAWGHTDSSWSRDSTSLPSWKLHCVSWNASSSARFDQESKQAWVELHRQLQREALGRGNHSVKGMNTAQLSACKEKGT